MKRAIVVGNQTALSAPRPLEPFRFALRHRFGAFEWFEDQRDGRGFAFAACDGACRERLRAIGARRGLYYSVHAALRSNVADPEDRALAEAVAFASAIGAAVVVTHFPDTVPRGEIAAGLAAWAARAAAQALCLTVENTPATAPADLNTLFERAFPPAPGPAAAPDPNHAFAGVCFDMGHANLHPEWRNDYIGYLDQLATHAPLRHVHVHENHGDHDSHLPLFTGPAARSARGIHLLIDRLRSRGYRGALVMEQWPFPPHLLCEARDKLKLLLDHH